MPPRRTKQAPKRREKFSFEVRDSPIGSKAQSLSIFLQPFEEDVTKMFRIVTLLCSLFVVQGFNVPSQHRNFVRKVHFRRHPGNYESLQSLQMGKEDNLENESQIARLKAASAKLRAEVAELEAAAKKESAKAVEEVMIY